MASKADIDKPVSLVRPSSAKTVQRILDRAHKVEAAQSKAVIRNAKAISSGGKRGKSVVARTLGLALAYHGRSKKNAPSIRPIAKDTGGRSYHYSHTTITKNGGGGTSKTKAASGNAGSPSGDKKTASSTKGSSVNGTKTKESAHQAYVERDSAVDKAGMSRTADASRELAAERTVGSDREQQTQQPGLDGVERTPNGAQRIKIDLDAVMEGVEKELPSAHAASAAAAQAYIEDPSKIETRWGHATSFGTLGKTPAERLAFWDLVHKHERSEGSRTQTRLILELPHDTTPASRQEIVSIYCAWFEERGIPYWAAIHAPSKNNDSRNFHAHIVHMERPAKLMTHPQTGEQAWDFTIKESHKTSSRNTRFTHPYRQTHLPEMRDIHFVKLSRERYAKTVNEVMERQGSTTRYDPRSYKDMGLEIKPMQSISRIQADKMKSGDFVAMDADWTRAIVEREMAAARLQRDATYKRLDKVERELQEALAVIRKPLTANAKLPKGMKLAVNSRMTAKLGAQVAAKILEAERDRLAELFIQASTRRTLVDIVDATSPNRKNGKAGPRKARKGAEEPDKDVMAALHEAARIELREHDAQTRSWHMRTGDKIRAAYARWTREARPPLGPAPQPAPPEETRKPIPSTSAKSAVAPASPTVDPQRPMRTQFIPSASRPPMTVSNPMLQARPGLMIPRPPPAPQQQAAEQPRQPSVLAQTMNAMMQSSVANIADLMSKGLIDTPLTPAAMDQFMKGLGHRNAALREAHEAVLEARAAAQREAQEQKTNSEPEQQTVPVTSTTQDAATRTSAAPAAPVPSISAPAPTPSTPGQAAAQPKEPITPAAVDRPTTQNATPAQPERTSQPTAGFAGRRLTVEEKTAMTRAASRGQAATAPPPEAGLDTKRDRSRTASANTSAEGRSSTARTDMPTEAQGRPTATVPPAQRQTNAPSPGPEDARGRDRATPPQTTSPATTLTGPAKPEETRPAKPPADPNPRRAADPTVPLPATPKRSGQTIGEDTRQPNLGLELPEGLFTKEEAESAPLDKAIAAAKAADAEELPAEEDALARKRKRRKAILTNKQRPSHGR